ncbi:MAG: efflux RND transporter periplasmic adaptor subunit [Clostridia bacterium]
MKKRWWIIGAAVLGIAGVGGYSMMSGKQQVGTFVSLAPVEQSNLQSKVLTSGEIKVKNPVTLYAGTDGFLREFTVKTGDRVKQGQVIGKIDQSDMNSRLLELDAQIELKRADLAKARVGEEPEAIAQLQERMVVEQRKVETAKREYDRTQSLFQSGVSTQQELDRAREALTGAQSELKIAQQNLALKQKGPRQEELASIEAQIKKLQVDKAQLEKDRVQSVIQAPFDGTILSLKAENGQFMSRGKEIALIGDLTKLTVEAQVSESDAPKLSLNQEAAIEDNALGKKQVKARISHISPIAETTDSTQGKKTRVAVTLDLLEPAPQLKPGYQVDVDILILDLQNTLQVPIEAIQQDQAGATYVWVAENGVAKKRSVEVGVENELFSEVKSGVKAGDNIILNPSEMLKENDPVIDQPQMMTP